MRTISRGCTWCAVNVPCSSREQGLMGITKDHRKGDAMTPTQIARRSDALYADGTRGMTRRVLCDMVAQRESDLEDAKAENAKLRELVRWMYERMDESCAAQYPYAPTPISYDRLMQAFARARELGVEVDDG